MMFTKISGFPKLILWHHDLAWTTPRYRQEMHDGYPWNLLCTNWDGVTQVVVSELRRQELSSLLGSPPGIHPRDSQWRGCQRFLQTWNRKLLN